LRNRKVRGGGSARGCPTPRKTPRFTGKCAWRKWPGPRLRVVWRSASLRGCR
jgi:hypothetical protein